MNAIFYNHAQWGSLASDAARFAALEDGLPLFPFVAHRWRLGKGQSGFARSGAPISGQQPQASATILDSQSVKTVEGGEARGFDAGKKVPGRKRHVVVDTLGLVLVVVETVAISLFRVVQEGLQNALKHALARHIQISLKLRGSDLCAIVEDDGVGFSRPDRLSELTWNNHFGVVAMEDYMTWVGGALHIETRPGGGTKVSARVPLIQRGGSQNENNSNPDR